MTTPHPEPKKQPDHPGGWEERVGEREVRKIRARKRRERSIWFGLGTFGVVGWSIVVPTLIGIFAGLWIDRTWPSRFSWTLMLFLGGLFLGCYSAWHWLHFESGLIEHEEKEDEEDGSQHG